MNALRPLRKDAVKRIAAVVALVLALAVPAAAEAPSLEDLRAEGLVGETFDGYTVARSDDASVKSFVAKVNAKRKSIYVERAKTQGVAAAEVGKVYALEIFEKAPAGTWMQLPDGHWSQKK